MTRRPRYRCKVHFVDAAHPSYTACRHPVAERYTTEDSKEVTCVNCRKELMLPILGVPQKSNRAVPEEV